MIQEIYFYDWNGTLLGDALASYGAFMAQLAVCGYPVLSFEAFQEIYDIPHEKIYLGAGVPREDLPRVLKQAAVLFKTYEELASDAGLREGAAEVLRARHQEGAIQVVLSNYVVAPIKEKLASFGLAHTIDAVLACEDFALPSSPKAERMKAYLAARDFPQDVRMAVIGDTPEEILIARAFHCQGVALTGGYASEKRLQAVRPDHLVHSWAEMGALPRLGLAL